jgi:uncharacterized protein involved in response to NO
MQRSLHLHDPMPLPVTRPRLALAAKGFRPFFLLAASFAVAIVPLWLLILGGVVRPSVYLAPAVWHAHEMVFGFAVAVIAGFLLTAVGNWTQRETVVGTPLLALAGVWILGRIAMLLAGRLPPGLTAALDLAFVPALAFGVGRPLVATRNRRNLVMLVVLGALFATNVVVHLDALGVWPGQGRRACLVAIDVVVLVTLIIAGRVFPMFTRNATGVATIRSSPRLDVATVVGMAVVSILDAAAPASTGAVVTAGAVGVLAIARAWRWGSRHVGRNPLLWILHVGYAWIPIGLLLRAAARFDPALPESLAIHALTVGAVGSLTLGMMARVALGHTGRPLVASRWMSGAFASITAAALARVLAPIALPGEYFAELVLAGSLWTAAFVIYVAVYAPILCRSRVDGKAG